MVTHVPFLMLNLIKDRLMVDMYVKFMKTDRLHVGHIL